jgi:hypothetical protein
VLAREFFVFQLHPPRYSLRFLAHNHHLNHTGHASRDDLVDRLPGGEIPPGVLWCGSGDSNPDGLAATSS